MSCVAVAAADGTIRYARRPAQKAAWEHEPRGPHGKWVALYHGTDRDLKPGDLISPGHHPNEGASRAGYVYFTHSGMNALHYTHQHGGQGHVYRVAPTGIYGNDPDSNVLDHAYRSRSPLRVISEASRQEALKDPPARVRHSALYVGDSPQLSDETTQVDPFGAADFSAAMHVARKQAAEAYLHELRGEHGEWVRDSDAPAVRVRPPAPPHHPPARVAARRIGVADGAKISALPGVVVSPAAEAEVGRALDRQARYVPGLIRKLNVTIGPPADVIPGSGPMAAGSSLGNKLAIEPLIVHSDEAGEELRLGQRTGWWPPTDPGTTLPDMITAHEVGHGVSDQLIPAKLGRSELWDAVAAAAGVKPPSYIAAAVGKPGKWATPRSLAYWTKKNAVPLAKAVSKYGTHDPDELVAEMWAEFTLSAHPRDAARIYGEYMMSQLPKRVRS